MLNTEVAVASGSPMSNSTAVGIRLAGGSSANSGRVEVYHNGQWGTVCDDSFGKNDAKVACRQLGFDVNSSSYYTQHQSYGGGSGPIWMANLACTGSEASLNACSHNGWGSHNCSHSEDVGVFCILGILLLIAVSDWCRPDGHEL